MINETFIVLYNIFIYFLVLARGKESSHRQQQLTEELIILFYCTLTGECFPHWPEFMMWRGNNKMCLAIKFLKGIVNLLLQRTVKDELWLKPYAICF